LLFLDNKVLTTPSTIAQFYFNLYCENSNCIIIIIVTFIPNLVLIFITTYIAQATLTMTKVYKL